jgi:hypothetical protein
MKDIYELLNDMDIDESEFEEMEVSEWEKAKVTSVVKASIHRRKRNWTRIAAAAVLTAGLSAVMLGITFPAYANNIPVIDNIFRLLDSGKSGLFDHYKEYSSDINLTEESNGITFTINDAVFDGETVFITYSLVSNQDLGIKPVVHGLLDIKGTDGVAGGNQISKVGPNKYAGLITGTGFSNVKDKKTASVKWSIDSLVNPNNKQEITGNWDFALKVMATDSSTQTIDRSIQHNGAVVHIHKITFTPMSFILYYDQTVDQQVRSQWDAVDVGIKIKDDLGNHYTGQGNGGAGDKEGYNMNWSKTFEKLEPKATKLIITPQLSLYNHTSDNHGSVEMSRDGADEQIPLQREQGNEREEIELEDIIVELKK